MACRFRLKNILNVRFQFSNVRFFCLNIRFFRFFECTADMQCPVMKRMILVQKEIAKERFYHLAVVFYS